MLHKLGIQLVCIHSAASYQQDASAKYEYSTDYVEDRCTHTTGGRKLSALLVYDRIELVNGNSILCITISVGIAIFVFISVVLNSGLCCGFCNITLSIQIGSGLGFGCNSITRLFSLYVERSSQFVKSIRSFCLSDAICSLLKTLDRDDCRIRSCNYFVCKTRKQDLVLQGSSRIPSPKEP